MELNFLSVADINNKAKATIHLSGKLGFNMEASELMKLDKVLCFKIALDGDLKNYTHIYLQPSLTEDENCIKVLKAGDYYSLPLASVFNTLNINYVDYKIMFDILVDEYKGQEIFKLKRRPKDIKRPINKSSKEEDEE